MKANLKKYSKFTFKLILGAGVIFYVLRSKMVDFETLSSVIFKPLNLAVSLVFLTSAALCCASRWFLLVRAQSLTLSFKSLFELTMIGNFFNTFMPGAVGGDLIKAWYVAGQEPKQRTKAVFTVLLDRVVGLAVIIFYSAFTLLFYTEWLQGQPQLQAVAYTIWGFTTFCIVFAGLFFSPLWERLPLRPQFENLLRKSGKLEKILEASLKYRHHKQAVALGIILSALSVLMTNILYSAQGATIGITMPLPLYFFVVPLGLTISAVPLLPGGIGVGQVAFYSLFQWIGQPPEQGATLCTMMQVYTILFNCLGAFFYLKFKKRPNLTTSLQMQRAGL